MYLHIKKFYWLLFCLLIDIIPKQKNVDNNFGHYVVKHFLSEFWIGDNLMEDWLHIHSSWMQLNVLLSTFLLLFWVGVTDGKLNNFLYVIIIT